MSSTIEKNKKRVVVTGLGIVSSIGIGWKNFWNNLLNGRSRVNQILCFDTLPYERHVGCEILDFKPENYLSNRMIKKFGRSSQMAIIASKLALEDANLELKNVKVGLCMGTTMGESQNIENIISSLITTKENNNAKLLTLLYPSNIINTSIAREFRLDNLNLTFATACSAGNYAIGTAFDLIHSGKQDYMLAGGVDSFSRIAFTGFNRLFAVAPGICQPFDKNRKGILLGEGAGMLVLESFDNARKRGATIYAEILGYGLTCDSKHMTIPTAENLAKTISKSLRESGVEVNQVDHINAHGTGTRENDKVECRAFSMVFGERLKEIPITSIKSVLGHTMGAASAFETIASCLSLRYGIIPPTINFFDRAGECNINCVANYPLNKKINIVLNNSQAFGGNNAALVLSKLN